MRKGLWLLFFVVVLGSVLRLYQLGKTPVSLEWDEVAIGYDAYSILKTGRDQFGQFFPITFRSLDDWKPPIYEYLAIVPIAVFGLTQFAVRIPTALFGIGAVVITYFLSREIFEGTKGTRRYAGRLSLMAAFLLAVSPWHLQFSRAAFEVNVSGAITMAAVLLFFVGLRRPALFVASAVLFGLDLFSYHSTRVVAPLLLVSLFFLFLKYMPAKRYVAAFLLIFGIFFAAFIPIATSPDAQIRFRATNIFDPGARWLDEKDLPKEFLDKRLLDEDAGYEWAGKLFHNSRLIFTDYDILKKAFYNYTSHFGFEYLFVRGDAPLHHAPGFGLFHIVEFPFIVIGLCIILFYARSRYTLAIIAWMLIAPIPVAVTRGAPHGVRSELMLPTLQVIGAVGWVYVFSLLRREHIATWLLAVTGVSGVFMINNAYYLHQYYVHTNYELSKNWIYGRQEAAAFTEEKKNQYDRVLVSIKVDMPHMFWLFYTKYDPATYLRQGGTMSGGFAEERNTFDKYEFRNFTYDELPVDEKLLLVSVPEDFPPNARILKTIYYLDGKPALVIAENTR